MLQKKKKIEWKAEKMDKALIPIDAEARERKRIEIRKNKKMEESRREEELRKMRDFKKRRGESN